MLNEKLNLYNPEWLELVFSDRNKSYGAYELRKHYGTTIAKAMAIAFSAIIVASAGYTYAKSRHVEPTIIKDVEIVLPPPPSVAPEKKVDKVIEPKTAAPKQLPAAPTVKFTTPRITPEEVNTNPPIIAELANVEIGSETKKGDGGQAQMADPGPITGTGGMGTDPGVDVNKEYISVEKMPEPDGGAAGWGKFLSKNLRYPSQAQEEGKSGRVTLSFVVERDGRLTDITVIGKAGYGMDEEAARVLKLAKNWKPGIQNGSAVRVRFTIPINFQLSE